MSRPTSMSFEERYSDDSGVEFGVRFFADRYDNEIEIERIDKIGWPADRIDWLVDRLRQIQRAAILGEGE